MRFDELNLGQEVLEAVRDMGHTEPTPVQERTIPVVLSGRDVMATAQTGTGKTLAFVLPACTMLAHAERPGAPRMLVITPTRELAQQISEVCDVVGARTGHVTLTVVGGVGYGPQQQALRKRVDVLVATPGRLVDLVSQNALSLADVKILVLDEADRMLDMGFLPDVRRIVSKTPRTRQTLLFSATLSDDVVKNTRSLVKRPAKVEVAPRGTAAQTVRQYVLYVEPEAKKRTLVGVLRTRDPESAIVFVRGKYRADHLSRTLVKKGFASAPIHGNRSQNQRMRALERFAQGEVRVLVATDVLARGIDVEAVSCVINVDVPHETENYIHRIGRTGRAGNEGWALTLCSDAERKDLKRIERLMGKRIARYPEEDAARALGEQDA